MLKVIKNSYYIKKCLPYSNCLLKCTIFCSTPLSLLTKAVCKHTACWIITCTHAQNSDILLYKTMQLEISYRKQWTAHTVFTIVAQYFAVYYRSKSYRIYTCTLIGFALISKAMKLSCGNKTRLCWNPPSRCRNPDDEKEGKV